MNQKGFIKDVVIIALAILLLGGGYFYFSKKSAYAPAENTNQNQIVDETKDWKTYKDEKYGFEFKYPPEYNITYENGYIFLKDSLERGGLYAIKIIENPKKMTAVGYFNSVVKKFTDELGASYGYDSTRTKEIKINGLNGVDTYYSGGGGNGRSMYISIGDSIINIDYGIDNLLLNFNGDEKSFNEYIKNGEAMISTVKKIY